MAKKKTSSRSAVTGGTWLLRALIAIVAGVAIGAATGVAGVNKLEPGRPGQPDSLAVMLDSLKQLRESDDPRTLRRAADSADAAQRAQRRADSIALANDPNAPLVPDVRGFDEGAARSALDSAGLKVGAVQFRADTAAAGVVLSTLPAAGQKVRPSTTITLVLSDGRTPPSDTLDSFAVPSRLP